MNEMDRLPERFAELGLKCSVEPFLNYLDLLAKWNQSYNLTAVREIDQMVTHHLLDSLAIGKWLHGDTILDVGTGAGLPGIPLAIANPKLHVVLIDSNGKKIRFLREAKRVLNLKNVTIEEGRVENFDSIYAFDTIVSRALSDLSQFVKHTEHLISDDGGIWIAMKGKPPLAELKNFSLPYRIENYHVPGLDETRCCVIIQKE